MPSFATGKYSIAFCARCDQQLPYRDLRPQIINQIVTNLLVCDECLDIDQEQLQVGRIIHTDPQALENARPDVDIPTSRGFYGWKPVLGMAPMFEIGQAVAA